MSIESQIMDNALRTPSAPGGLFTLPCGHVEETEGGLVLYREVELKEMTGQEEDLLANPRVPYHKKMSTLIAACIVRLSTVPPEEGPDITDKGRIRKIVDRLLLGDRTFLFFALRRASLGDIYPFKDKCPDCEQSTVINFNLSFLEIVEMAEPKKRDYAVELPSGAEVEFGCMDGVRELRRDKLKKRVSDHLTLQILLRARSINGNEPTVMNIKSLSMRDRDRLRAYFAEVDGGVETEIEVTCPLCGFDYTRELDPGNPSFFSPSETSVIWNRRSNT